MAKLKADNPQENAFFGNSVSIYDQYIAIGARMENISINTNQGAVYIFKKENSSWVQQARLVADDGGMEDEFGYSVSINNEHVIIGSLKHHSTFFTQDDGAAYIFSRSGSTWNLSQKLTHPNPVNDNYFGN